MKEHLQHSKMVSLLVVMTLFSVLGNKLYAQENQILKSATAAAAISGADSLVLVSLYNATDGANWTIKTNWLTTEPINTWYGITVVSDEIREINLKDNNLAGPIPADLGDLLSLQYLDLDTNQLTGAIPVELGNLTNLEYLYLNGNQLSGTIPVELTQLTNLLLLYLNNNLLTGTIPTDLNLLTKLKWLNLSRNQLTGSIPAELGQLPDLEFLQLATNQLSGSIPVELGVLPTLRWLSLGDNQLTGSIPVELGLLSDVLFEQLYLNGNLLTGTIPTVLGNLTGLKWLNLGQNQLTGAIPVELSTLPNLELLYLDGNQLTTIPVALGLLTGLEWLNLSDNQITGNIPAEIWNMTGLQLLYLNENQLTGTIPDDLTSLTSLKWLFLNSNQLTSIPDFTVDADSLIDLDVSNNQLTFEDLEYNMDIIPDTLLTYSPQDSIGENLEFIKNAGETLTYTLTTGGTQNSYQWYKDGDILVTQISATLEISGLVLADAGKYYCKVTNTLVPGLTLTSRKITLLMNDQLQLTFSAGWNIFSSLVMPENKNLKDILQPLIDAEVLKKVMNESGDLIEDWGVSNGGWQNTIGDIENTEGYKINVLSAATLDLTGIPTQLSLVIPLSAGWNIISWPSSTEQGGSAVFDALITGGQLRKVMDESGNVIEDWGPSNGGWHNFIGTLKPGEGYKVNVTTACTLTVDSGSKSEEILTETVPSSHFIPAFVGNGTDHMNINLLNLAESGIVEGDEIGIFDGNVCVGSAKVSVHNSSSINLIASADGGNIEPDGFKNGSDMQLKLFRNGKEYLLSLIPVSSPSIMFERNGTLFARVNTDLNTAVVLPENEFNVAFYPNPFNQVLNIEINFPQREDLTVEVYDLLSRRIRQLYSGSAEGMMKLQWDGNDAEGNRAAPGVYICRVNGIWEKVLLNGR